MEMMMTIKRVNEEDTHVNHCMAVIMMGQERLKILEIEIMIERRLREDGFLELFLPPDSNKSERSY